MGRKCNFGAGPCCLPLTVLMKAQEEMLNWNGTGGMSVMEMSHRGKDFESIISTAEKDMRELLKIPDNFKVMFLQGGATTQFASVPLNLLGLAKKGGKPTVGDYIVTGPGARRRPKSARSMAQATWSSPPSPRSSPRSRQ